MVKKKVENIVTIDQIANLLDKKLETFKSEINLNIDTKFDKFQVKTGKQLGSGFIKVTEYLDLKLEETKDEIKSEFKHLPNSDKFYTETDKLMGELAKNREQQAGTQGLYDTVTKRIEIIDEKLGINSLTLAI